MKDGIIKGNGTSRYLKGPANALTMYPTYEDFMQAYIAGTLPIDLNGINPDGWTQQGSALNKANMLPDDVAASIGLTGDPQVKDALGALSTLSVSGCMVDVITESMTYTPKAKQALVICIGGGGGGGNSSNTNCGGGGGGGGYVTIKTVSLPLSSYSVTVGAGGGVSSNGGSTSFGNLVSASGGGGGKSGSASRGGDGGDGCGGGGGGGTYVGVAGTGGNGGNGQFGGGGGGGGGTKGGDGGNGQFGGGGGSGYGSSAGAPGSGHNGANGGIANVSASYIDPAIVDPGIYPVNEVCFALAERVRYGNYLSLVYYDSYQTGNSSNSYYYSASIGLGVGGRGGRNSTNYYGGGSGGGGLYCAGVGWSNQQPSSGGGGGGGFFCDGKLPGSPNMTTAYDTGRAYAGAGGGGGLGFGSGGSGSRASAASAGDPGACIVIYPGGTA